jgi:hypothetical protein
VPAVLFQLRAANDFEPLSLVEAIPREHSRDVMENYRTVLDRQGAAGIEVRRPGVQNLNPCKGSEVRT